MNSNKIFFIKQRERHYSFINFNGLKFYIVRYRQPKIFCMTLINNF